MRFLLQWQGVTVQPKPEGIASLERTIEQLEGFEVAAAAWEEDVLPARLQQYDGAWLDSLCLSGRASRAATQARAAVATSRARNTYQIADPGKNRALRPLMMTGGNDDAATFRLPHAMADYLAQHGASFFDEIVQGTRSSANAGARARYSVWSRRTGERGQLWRSARIVDAAATQASAEGARTSRASCPRSREAGRWSLLQLDCAQYATAAARSRRRANMEAARAGCCCIDTEWYPRSPAGA